MRPRALAMTLIALLAVTLLMPAGQLSDGTASQSDISITYEEGDLTLKAGGSCSVNLVVYNVRASGQSGIDDRVIYISTDTDSSMLSVSIDNTQLIIQPSKYRESKITITADPYASMGIESVTVKLTIVDPGDNSRTTVEKDFDITITSNLSAGDMYNKILGIWANSLPAPFNEPTWTAMISFVIFVGIGIILSWMCVPLSLFLLIRRNKESRAEITEGVTKLVFTIVVMYSVVQCLHIAGASEYLIGTAQTLSNLVYITVGAVIAWRVYNVLIKFVFHNVVNNVDVDGVDDSLVPLFKMIGKIGITVIALASILASLGFNLMAIVTSAGIVGLAISLGAQSMLQQFFSGLTLLMTRPFKAGDLVRLGADTAILRVRKVGIMNSQFENWENAEVFSLPNNTVTGNKIVNMTGESRAYRVLVYMTVAYGEDLEKAKQIMFDVAMEHPQVIKDGSYDRPATRLTAFQDSAIEIRLAVYVNEFEDFGIIGGQLRERIYNRFVEAGINIPFPQMDVHLKHDQ
jgi:potassium-dependent mechanosensitive channel